jgi:hypothetical protein
MGWFRVLVAVVSLSAWARAQEVPPTPALTQALDAVSVAAQTIDRGGLTIGAVQRQADLILFYATRLPALTVGMNNVQALEADLSEAAARLVTDSQAHNEKAVGADARRILGAIERLRTATGVGQ